MSEAVAAPVTPSEGVQVPGAESEPSRTVGDKGQTDLEIENAKLRAELTAMKAAQVEIDKKKAEKIDSPATEPAGVAVDEEKLADKIRGLLMADMHKANQRLLEQHAEELQLSLLTRLKMETERFNETLVGTSKELPEYLGIDSKSGKNPSRRRRKKKRGKSKRSFSHSSLHPSRSSMYEAVEPNVLPRQHVAPLTPTRSQSVGKSKRANQIPSPNDSLQEEGPFFQGREGGDPAKSDAPWELEDGFRMPPKSPIVAKRPSMADSDAETEEVLKPHMKDEVREEEKYKTEEFDPIDVQSLEDINASTAELLRQSRELTMTIGDNEYVKGLKSVAGLKSKTVKSTNAGKKVSKRKKKGKRGSKKQTKSKIVKQTENNSADDDEGQKRAEETDENALVAEEKPSESAKGEKVGEDTLRSSDGQEESQAETKSEENNIVAVEEKDTVEGDGHHHHLGPLKNTTQFDGKPPAEIHPATVKLGKREWENEVARNILVLYKANMNAQRELDVEPSTVTNDSAATADLKGGKSKDLARESTASAISSKPSPAARKKRGSRGRPRSQTLPKIAGAEAKPNTMMQIKYGGSAKKTHNPTQIWFAGAGNVRAVWDGLTVTSEEEAENAMQKLTSDSKLVGELDSLEKAGSYFKYIAIVEAILTARARIFERTENHWRLWRQLAVSANVFGVKYVEEGKFNQALQMLKHSQKLCDMTSSTGADTLPRFNRYELKGFINDSMSYYYYKRHKPHAALQYAEKAMKIHHRLQQWEHVAKCHLHTGAILSKLQRHDEAIRAMGQVLKMVEDERLESGGPSSQKICLIAVTYHNIAVEQLLLSRVMEACVSSQNARRLARLSLSYSNRWIQNFEATHRLALTALSTQKEVRTQIRTKDQSTLFMDLSKTMYS